MTTNKPEAVAYRYTSSRSFGKRNPKWHYQESFPHAENRKVEEIGQLEKLIRLSDYESLQSECDRWKNSAHGAHQQLTANRLETEKLAVDWSKAIAECERLRKDAEFGRSVLSKREPGKVYGCHCDLEEGMEPDGCVIDSGERHNCIHANDISAKEQCSHWRVIAIDADIQENPK